MLYHPPGPLDFPINSVFSCDKLLPLSAFSDISPAVSTVALVQQIMGKFAAQICALWKREHTSVDL